MPQRGHVASSIVATTRRLVMAAAVSLGAGCAPWATYPPVEYGGQALTRPTFEPIPTLMALAIRHAHTKHDGPAEIIINLPAGADAATYDRVIETLGEGRPMTSPRENAYHVTEVRTRAFDSEVDLIYPTGDGDREFATISFDTNVVSGHRVTDVRTWRIRFETPAPHYAAPADAPATAVAAPGAEF